MKTSEILFKAAQIIERDGWCQHQGQLGDRHCLFGAIREVVSYGLLDESFNYLRDFIGTNPIVWNDSCERTAEEVIDMLVIASVEAASEERTRGRGGKP